MKFLLLPLPLEKYDSHLTSQISRSCHLHADVNLAQSVTMTGNLIFSRHIIHVACHTIRSHRYLIG